LSPWIEFPGCLEFRRYGTGGRQYSNGSAGFWSVAEPSGESQEWAMLSTPSIENQRAGRLEDE
jgi:hypothetical protein